MNSKENSLNKRIFKKISKNGILENNKNLLINKFGLHNLSQTNLFKQKKSTKKNIKKYNKNSISFSKLKIETKKNFASTTKNSNNISLYSSNEYLNSFSEFKKSSGSCSKKSLINNKVKRNNKSCASLFHNKPKINLITYSSLNKKINIIKEGINNNINSNIMTTAQNTFKTNLNSKNSYSYIDILGISPIMEPSTKDKSKKKINIKMGIFSTPNLLNKAKRPIIKDNEKSYKILNDRNIYNKSLYNYNNHKYKPLIKTCKNSNSKNKSKILKPLDISKKNINNKDNKKLNKKENKVDKAAQNNTKKNQKLSTILQSDIINKENEDSKTSVISVSKNSEDTKKESRLDLHKIFNEKILNNLNNKNNIYNIISNNMKLNNKNSQKNVKNININKQETISVEKNIEKYNNFNYIRDNEINEENNNKKKLSMPLLNSDVKFDLYHMIKKELNNININGNKININYNNNEDEKYNQDLIDDTNKNLINYSDIQENININYNCSEDYNKGSSIKANNNIINNKYYNLSQLNEENNQEQELQISQDKNNEPTQTFFERNNIISKFIKQPIYDISPRFFCVEQSAITKYSLKSKSFMFIEDIEQKNKNIPIINIKKILKLNDDCIFKLLSFSYDNYSSIISSTNLLKNKINNSLNSIFYPIIKDFENKYRTFLKVLNFSFQYKKLTNNHKKSNLFNLIIKCQIITKDIKKSYEIGCNYISNGKKYDIMWKFDVQKKSEIKLWLCTELEVIKNSYKKFTYTSQVSSFSYQDEIELEFNILSKGKIINPYSIEWLEPIITKVDIGIYENKKFISKIKFDQLRACKVETQILFWKNKLPKDDKGIVEKFKKIFEQNFKIEKIYFDVSKYYFFKFEMIADKIGIIKQNIFSTFDINIVHYESHIKNEIQCIYLINSNYYNKIMDIRLGTNVTFYIIDMKR